MVLECRGLDGGRIGEVFVTVDPGPGEASAEQCFSTVARVLADSDARIVEERVFVTPGCWEEVLAARASVYGDLDDGSTRRCCRWFNAVDRSKECWFTR